MKILAVLLIVVGAASIAATKGYHFFVVPHLTEAESLRALWVPYFGSALMASIGYMILHWKTQRS